MADSQEAPLPKVSIKSPGSFGVSREALEEKIQGHKATQEAAAAGVDDAQKKKAESAKNEAQKEREAEIDKLLPENVLCLFGEVPFGVFKECYKGVWEQVADKVHLARGFVSFATEIQPDLPVVVRSFRAKEFRQLQFLSPSPDTDFKGYLDENTDFRNSRLVVALTRFGEETLPDIGSILAEAGLEKWQKNENVIQRLDWIDNFPEELVGALSALVADVTTAYRLAVQENLKNQLAPLSPSTE